MTFKKMIILFPFAALSSVLIFLYMNRPAEPDRTELDLYFRAVSAYENADFNVSRKITEALVTGNPTFHQAALLKAKAEFFSGLYAEAGETLVRLLKRKKSYHEAEVWLLRCLVQLEDLGNAEALGEDLLSRSPEDPRILGTMASIALLDSEYQKAIEYYTRSTLFEEELALNRIELAKIYSSLLNPELAVAQLKRALLLLSADSPLRKAVSDLLIETESRL